MPRGMEKCQSALGEEEEQDGRCRGPAVGAQGGVQGTPLGRGALAQGRSQQQSAQQVPNLEAPLCAASPK